MNAISILAFAVLITSATHNKSVASELPGSIDQGDLTISLVDHKNINIAPSKEDKVIVRHYTYMASEDDSRNSSRKKAIQQIKTLLSEEIGTHIESYLTINETEENGVNHKVIKQEISSLSAGITQLKVISESWDGKQYDIEASVSVNIKQAMALLLEAIKAKSSEKDVARLNKVLAEQEAALKDSNNVIAEMNKKLVIQEILLAAKKAENIALKEKRIELNNEQQEYNNQVTAQKKEMAAIKAKMVKVKSRIKKQSEKACLLEKGMTKNEVKSIIGSPDSKKYGGSKSAEWNYGTVRVKYQSSLVSSIFNCALHPRF